MVLSCLLGCQEDTVPSIALTQGLRTTVDGQNLDICPAEGARLALVFRGQQQPTPSGRPAASCSAVGQTLGPLNLEAP